MKKSILILSLCAVIAACNSKSDKNGSSDSTAAANQSAKAQNSNADTNSTKTGTEPAGTTSVNANGAKLMAAADCMSCHKEQVKLVGPAFKEIANKYKAANDAMIDTLANKVIKGGKGNWGEVPMTPHPTIAVADAKEMVKYILTVK